MRADAHHTPSGPEGIRTPDLLSAIEARSQLRYRPSLLFQGASKILPEVWNPVKEKNKIVQRLRPVLIPTPIELPGIAGTTGNHLLLCAVPGNSKFFVLQI